MGILVHSGFMQNGIHLSNVYVCLSDGVIQVVYKGTSGLPRDLYEVRGFYKVLRDPTKRTHVDIQEELCIKTENIERSVYEILYDGLKQLFPDSINML
jgi:hypothetical protein